MFASFLLRRRALVLAIWILGIVLALTAFAIRITDNTPWIDNSVGIWFQTDDPELLTYNAHNKAFGEQEWTLLMLATPSIFDAGFLQDLAAITTRIEALKHVVKVTSIANVRDNNMDDSGDLNYATLYPAKNGQHASEQEIAALRQHLHSNPVFQNNLLRKESDRHTIVLIQNDNLIHDPSPYRITLVDSITDIVNDYDSIIDSALAGTTVVNAALNRASKHDVIIFYILISLFLFIFSFLVFKNWRDLVTLLSVIIGSIIPIMALIAYLKLPYNMMTVMLPTIMAALGVASVVHVINTFHRLHRLHETEAALHKTLSIVIRPGFYAMLTTTAGFASLTLSTVTPVFQLGLFAAIGIILAWMLSITVAPVLLYILWQKKHKTSSGDTHWPWLQKLTTPWAGRTWVLVIIALTLPLSGLLQLETDTNYSEFFADDVPVSQAYQKITDAGFAQNPINIGLVYPEGTTYEMAPYFQAVIRFEQAVESLPQMIKLLSPNALVREIDKAFNGDVAATAETSAADRLTTYPAEAISQLLFLAELSGNDDITDLLTQDRDRSQLLALTDYMSSKELDAFNKEVMTLAQQHLPSDMQAYLTGTTTLWANMDRKISITQLQSLLIMALFLSLILLMIFRSFKLTLLAIIVNGLPLAIVLGIMGLLGFTINIATALIGGIILGVVIDDTLHLLMRVQENRRQNEKTAIATAINDVGRSIVYTTFIIVGGFASMMTSDFSPSAEFGAFVSLAVVLALLLDLWLLPQLLRLAIGRQLPALKRKQEST
ncbi:MAG: efflux RND transporter permease subunit [Gammaproteobacteria bacterium]|nr:efflux RND transporter permease subunit [Gammaproteobacteria bacterium]